MLVGVFEKFIETCCKERKCYPFHSESSLRFSWDAGFKHTNIEKQISKKKFLFLENAFRDGTFGCMGKRDEDSVSDIKVVEGKQLDNFEDNLQEHVN